LGGGCDPISVSYKCNIKNSTVYMYIQYDFSFFQVSFVDTYNYYKHFLSLISFGTTDTLYIFVYYYVRTKLHYNIKVDMTVY